MSTDVVDITGAVRIKDGQVVIVQPGSEVYVDIECEVCGGLIPFSRYISALTRPNAKAKYCCDTCMNTAHVRAHRKNVRR